MANSVDILMITHKRHEYLRLALPRLLSTMDGDSRLSIWHNGPANEAWEVVQENASHPSIHEVVFKGENTGLREPTNWLWKNSDREFVSKVDDDCLESVDWLSRLRKTHEGAPETGVLGTWRFYDEDFHRRIAGRKVQTLHNGQKLLRNHWVQGSGYLARRELIERIGGLGDGESFPAWCIRAARTGAVNGWAYPFVHEEHCDDPRSPYTLMTTEQAFQRYKPLGALQIGADDLRSWRRHNKDAARYVQFATLNVESYFGPRDVLRRGARRLTRYLVGRDVF